jgi:hypothetical protein
MAIADTGASDHYFMESAPLVQIDGNAPITKIRTATGELKASLASALLAIRGLPTQQARTVHIIPGFTNNLLSLGKLCDADCTAYIDKNHLNVYNSHGQKILHGDREQTGARLWRVNIAPAPANAPAVIEPDGDSPTSVNAPSPANAPAVIEPNGDSPTSVNRPPTALPQQEGPQPTPVTRPNHVQTYDLPGTSALIAYLHAVAGFPPKATWLAAIKRGAYCTWPGLTYTQVARYCPDADETTMGHMAQPRQHIRSTQQRPQSAPAHEASMPTVPTTPSLEIEIIPVNRIFTDDTGRLTPRSRAGNQYIMVCLHTQSNAILVRAFQSKSNTHRIAAYNATYQRLKACNDAPTEHILDNKVSAAFKSAITNNNCTFQLVPPHVHRRNKAERAIRTFKDHFLAILAGLAPTFPSNRWDLLLPQAELTLNLLRPGTDPTKLAWECLFGPYNFDATPMGPTGCKVLIHNKAGLRKSWDYRCKEGYYVGPALQHYRCYQVISKDSGALTISDVVKFKHHYLPEPTMSVEDKLLHAVQAINHTLNAANHQPTQNQLAAIDTLRNILQDYKQTTSTTNASVHNLPDATVPLPGVRQPTVLLPGVPEPPEVVAELPGVADAPPTTNEWTTVVRRGRHQEPKDTNVAIAHRTRAKSHNAFALLAKEDDNDDKKTYHTTHNDTPHLANPVLNKETGETLEHRQLRQHPKYKETWDASYSKELGRLCQGLGNETAAKPSPTKVEGTDTFRPIHFGDIPVDRCADVTYTKVVCEVRSQKEDPNRTRITIGGNRICYPGDTGTRTGSLEVVKLQANSVLSTLDARFACYDISNFYLGTPLDRPEYVRIKLADITQDFIDEYQLEKYAHNGWVYFEITKGVYGLKQAGKLANDLLDKRLSAHGYYQCPTTPGLWRHKWRPISFVLIVDNFGIQYVGKRHAEHLLHALQEHYKVTTDWMGSKFAGIDFKWDYAKQMCRLTMDGYIEELLLKYKHPRPSRKQHSPHAHREIVYGTKEQLMPEKDNSPPLDAQGIKRIQGIVGSLLYYARAVDNKLLATLSTISLQQNAATENTAKAVNQLLDYVATYPSDGITYRASGMVLAAHSDASYLTESNVRSRAGAHIYLL